MAKQLTWRKAVEKVLGSTDNAMHYKDIADAIVTEGLRTDLGATPSATVSVTLNTSIAKEGERSPFQRVGRGEYLLRSRSAEKQVKTRAASKTDKPTSATETEEQYEIVTSFGMFWRRDFVDWGATPQILGMQQIGAEAVDFNRQLGIYLLYDGREVIYVGRCTDRPLGRRLYEHTADRLATRWDRFSWFGLLPVSERGALGEMPETYHASKMIPAYEAMLIEALEPRQNRKRGDDLSAVEYLQKEDPEIDRKKRKAVLENALAKV